MSHVFFAVLVFMLLGYVYMEYRRYLTHREESPHYPARRRLFLRSLAGVILMVLCAFLVYWDALASRFDIVPHLIPPLVLVFLIVLFVDFAHLTREYRLDQLKRKKDFLVEMQHVLKEKEATESEKPSHPRD